MERVIALAAHRVSPARQRVFPISLILELLRLFATKRHRDKFLPPDKNVPYTAVPTATKQGPPLATLPRLANVHIARLIANNLDRLLWHAHNPIALGFVLMRRLVAVPELRLHFPNIVVLSVSSPLLHRQMQKPRISVLRVTTVAVLIAEDMNGEHSGVCSVR
jgi:hypothetical protein